MSAFASLWNDRQRVVDAYFADCREAEKHRLREWHAVIRIQSSFRGFRARLLLRKKRAAATAVQKLIRGWLARAKYRRILREYANRVRKAYYDHCAVQIQRIYRGYYSRKHVHDSRARREQLQRIREKGEALTAEMRVHHARMREEKERHDRDQEAQRYQMKLDRSHHLVGTRSIRGVYSGPSSGPEGAQLDGAPVEQRLWQSFRSLPAERRLAPTFKFPIRAEIAEEERVRSLTRNPLPTMGPFQSLGEIQTKRARPVTVGVHAAVPYGQENATRKQERRASELKRISDQDFITATKTHMKPPPYERSIHSTAPFALEKYGRKTFREDEIDKRIQGEPFKVSRTKGTFPQPPAGVRREALPAIGSSASELSRPGSMNQ